MRLRRLLPSTLLATIMLAVPAFSAPGIVFSIDIAPPALPVYEQPECPGEGYLWTPGYWAYSDDGGYFWVPGTWVSIPEPGYLWTPGYWGFENAVYRFHEGYWGPTIGFYGGVNYGFGYIGVGYEGGYWRGGAFFYNRSVNNVVHVTNVYEKTVVVNNIHVSYNGGSGGINARPNGAEEAAMRERHVPPVSAQASHVQAASTNREMFESANHGRPAVAAVARPGEFSGRGVVAARSAAPEYKAPAERGAPAAGGRAAAPAHARDIPQAQHNPIPSSGNASADRKLSANQQQLNSRQEQERQQLQQKQEADHQKIGNSAPPQKTQALEQKHQAQTNQLVQRHEQQQQNLQRQAPRPEQVRK